MTGFRRALPLGLAALFVMGVLLRLSSVFDALPERIASHYNASGIADGFQQKGSFALHAVLLNLVVLGLFVAVRFGIRKLPASSLNLPNRDYWLAPERRESTLARLADMLGWFGCATCAMLAATLELIVRANLAGTPLASISMGALLALYVVTVLGYTIGQLRGFRIKS